MGKSDAANAAIRAVLTALGEEYHATHPSKVFGPTRFGKKLWGEIKAGFKNRCAYCDRRFGKLLKAQQDHLVPINKDACGLHHPGNVVPCCRACQDREFPLQPWDRHLRNRWPNPRTLAQRQRFIESHVAIWGYPKMKRALRRDLSEHMNVLYYQLTVGITRIISEIRTAGEHVRNKKAPKIKPKAGKPGVG